MTLFMYCLFNDALRDSTITLRMISWLLRLNSQRTWCAMKGFWPNLIYCEAICPERLRKISEIFQDNGSSSVNINSGPPKHKTAEPKLDRDVRWCQASLSMPYWT